MAQQYTNMSSKKPNGLPIVEGTMGFLLVVGLFVTVVTTIANLVHFRDVGYPESATLLRVQEFLSTGQLYPDFNRPPYLVTLYGPLYYALLGGVYTIAQMVASDPRTVVRLAIIASFSICVLTTFRIGQRLYPEGSFAFVSLLFAISIAPLSSWTTQIRGDLPALALSLSSFYICLTATTNRRRLVAAICAGLALLVKQTSIAVPCAVLIWHFWRHEFSEGLLWIAVVIGTVFCGYAVACLREPFLLEHFAALGSPFLEFSGALRLIGESLSQPQSVFGLFGVFLVTRQRDSNKLLLGCYWLVSWLAAMVAILQVGGNSNYFWEPLLVSAIGAGPGLVWVVRNVNRGPTFLRVFVALALIYVFFPVLKAQIIQLSVSYGRLKAHDHAQAEWNLLLSRISGHRILSTFPDITIQSRIPEVPDPFLNNLLAQRGKWDFMPILREIRSSNYDLVVVGSELASGGSFHRGVGIWPPAIWQALRRNYVQACVLQNMQVWLPRNNSSNLLNVLSTIDCKITNIESR